MAGLKYYVGDSETLGLDAKRHDVTQISIIRCSDLVQLSRYIKAERPENASREALIKTGRTYQDILKGDAKIDVIKRFEDFFNEDGEDSDSRCMICHNAPFDRRFLKAMWESVGKKFPVNNWLDTRPMAKKYAMKLGLEKPSMTLENILKFAEIKGFANFHNAIDDTRNLYLFWKKSVDLGIDYLDCIKRDED